MDFATVLVVAQNLLAALQSSQFKEICCVLGYKSEFEHFCNSVSAVRAVLLDASVKQEFPSELQLWIEELKDLVYKADDLLDEFIILAEQKQPIEGGKVSEEVCLFLSRFDLSGAANNMSLGVRKIRDKFDTIASNQNLLGFSIDFLPNRRTKEGIHSFVCGDKIIGREDDVAKIIDMLCDSHVQQDVSILPIVGIGGLGKSALAQLVYNDKRVISAFPLRLWTCVSDQDQHQFDLNQILVKILRSNTNCMFDHLSNSLLDKLLELVEGRKFLLVLDDVWAENRDQWLKLVEFFMAGRRGSWIVVTTRSNETAEVIGDGPIYELQGLSEENSWSLFERVAYEQPSPPNNLLKVGRIIVKDCAGVPLAIRLVGSLLYGQDESKWLSFQDIVKSANIREYKNIMPLLKMSYHQLEASFKSCFIYCALFPKDFVIEKELLISLWISQGFIIPSDDNQSIEDSAEEYFSVFFWRCFFQDVRFNEYGEIVSCKIHGLVHDIAHETVRKELHHPSILSSRYPETSFTKTCSRSYLRVDRMEQEPTSQFLKDSTCLRALVLRDSGMVTLPNSIAYMLHLRCLDLSYNSSLEQLPKSFANLHNLQTLRLRSCLQLKELPQDLSKLVKLRVLDIADCYRLTSIPSDLGLLTCLHTLTKFPVTVSSSEEQNFYRLQGLKALKHLKGHLGIHIRFRRFANYVRQEGSYLSSKDGLKDIRFSVEHVGNDAEVACQEALFDDMQPHPNLKGLIFFGYHGVRMPFWAKDDSLVTFLPNLVRLQLSFCEKLEHLPILGGLFHLKHLSIYYLPCLEYIDVAESGIIAKRQSFFSCLEELYLERLPRLKGWRKGNTIDALTCFPQLKLLRIDSCPNMASVFLCPALEDLQLLQFDRNLRIYFSEAQFKTWKVTSSSSHSSSLSEARRSYLPKIRSLITDNILWYNSLPKEVFQSLTHIVTSCMELKSLSQIDEILHSCASSLLSLIIYNTSEIRSLSGGLEHLTALESLVFEYLPNLLISSKTEKKVDIMAWRSFSQTLRSIEFKEVPKLVNLPAGMQYLTNLRVLSILDCPELRSLPYWMENLTSLRKLDIHLCSKELYERCQNPDGEDWFKIQHIPHISIS